MQGRVESYEQVYTKGKIRGIDPAFVDKNVVVLSAATGDFNLASENIGIYTFKRQRRRLDDTTQGRIYT